ncbi:MAG: general secretion pathway protein GspB [Mariprofundaceae bacterium]
MSYILDALKKSEQQRGSLAAADLHIPQTAPSHRRTLSIWRPILIVLLFGNTALLLWWMLQTPTPVQQLPAEKPPLAEKHVAATSALPPELRPTAIPESLQISRIETIQAQRLPDQLPVIEPDKSELDHLKVPAEQSLPTANAEAGPTESISDPISRHAEQAIPNIDALPTSVQQQLPHITIEGHIYAENPSARMVIINGGIRREGHAIASGFILEQITPDGVILNHQGSMFQMKVFQSWPL